MMAKSVRQRNQSRRELPRNTNNLAIRSAALARGSSPTGNLIAFFLSMKSTQLPITEIYEAVELDQTSETGLRWKRRPRHHFRTNHGWMTSNTRDAGKPAGSESIHGSGRLYFTVGINYTKYMCHRIVYLLAFGVDPGEMEVDHIDGNGRNNNPANLRLATHFENMHNRGANKNNTSGFKGVHFDKQTGRWRAEIENNGSRRKLGRFRTPEEAHAAYVRAAAELHGEFARAS